MPSTAIAADLAATASRRDLLRRSGLLGGYAALGGLLGPAAPLLAPASARAQEGGPDATGEVVARLDAAGSLDHATGLVTLDLAAVEEVAYAVLPEDQAPAAVAAFARHAELGFAVFGGPEAVASGRGVCLPWVAVEHLVGEGRETLPLEAQVAIVADLGLFDPRRGRARARTEEEVVVLLEKRFPNVAAELSPAALGYAATGRGFAPKDASGWVGPIVVILKKLEEAFFPPKGSTKRGIVACLRAGMVTTHWWGVRICFDRDCANEVIDFLRTGAKALTSGEVIAAIMGLGLSWYVGAIIAAAILVHVLTATVIAQIMETMLTLPGTRGACLELSWWLWLFGVPLSGASPWF